MKITDTSTIDRVAVSIICRGIEIVFRTANANAIAPRIENSTKSFQIYLGSEKS